MIIGFNVFGSRHQNGHPGLVFAIVRDRRLGGASITITAPASGHTRTAIHGLTSHNIRFGQTSA
jgi:hypothetical protein